MIQVKRGEIWLADLNPIRGSEQAGIRPVLIFQNDLLDKFMPTVLTIPLTTNTKHASLPSCLLIPAGEGCLSNDSVVLCHQLRVLDKRRLQHKIGEVSQETITSIESRILFTLGIFLL